MPLWKGRKNVKISYSQIDDKPINETFSDTLEFDTSDQEVDPEQPPPGTLGRSWDALLSLLLPTKIEGVDTLLQAIAPADGGGKGHESDVKAGFNGVRFQWRGEGVLAAVAGPSNWQMLGFFLANDPDRSDEDWIVTYFGKTLVSRRSSFLHVCGVTMRNVNERARLK